MAVARAASGRWESWQGLDNFYDDLANQLSALETIAEGLNGVADAADTVGEAVQIIEAILADDPVQGIFGAVLGQFAEFMNDLRNTDIYALPILPKNWSSLLYPYSVQTALNDVNASLNDLKDPNRPEFSGGAGFFSFTILVGANNWEDFRSTIKIFGELFSQDQYNKWSRLADLKFEFNQVKTNPIPRVDRNSQGVPWDWYRTNWTDLVPPLTRAVELLEDLANSISSTTAGIGRGLQNLAEVLRERAVYIQQVIAEVEKVARFLANLAQILPRAAVLGVYSPNGGTQEFQNALLNASNQPQYKLTAGITLLFATGNPVAHYEILKRLLGARVAGIENGAIQLQNLGD